ncbi:hypothetical protein [Clostridium tertium]|uniref:DUF2178 domain-containing protein n=1 Tax=Clostridium tertium TaxID=1559 RepID=A0A6N3B3B4_9CLOT
MLGIFCGSECNTNEEYKKYIKRRIAYFIGIIILGAITLAVTFLGDRFFNVSISEKMIAVYTGFGSGLISIGIILLIKNILLLKNEEKLRKSRISNTDERNKEISIKATRVALVVMLVAMYLVGLIGGLWYPVLIEVLLTVISVFLLAYLVAYKVISRKI